MRHRRRLFCRSNLFNVKQVETCDGAFHEGSLVSPKACALMLLNLQRALSPARSSNTSPRWRQDELAHPGYKATVFGLDAPSPQDCPALRPQALFATPQAKISADDPIACYSTTSVLASPVDSIQETTCTMVGKPLALPLLPVQTRESDTPSGYCSNPHVPTVMIIPNARHQRLASVCRTLS
jgi:hypothetical protein